jgi:hypothetical protein
MSVKDQSNEKPVEDLNPRNPQDPVLQDGAVHEDASVPRRVYLLYLALTAVLFVFLIVVAALALNQGWLPSR